MALDQLAIAILENLHVGWTFILLIVRFGALFVVLPGVGLGERGVSIREPAIFVLAMISLMSGTYAEMPENWWVLVAQVASEAMLGMALGSFPAMIVAGVQTAAHLSSTTMGLGAGQLLDPTFGLQVPSLGRIFGDVAIILFMLLGGHHVIIHAAAGLGGEIVPGSFLLTEASLNMFIRKTGEVFTFGVLFSAPVIVALLLTQFVMGLISKAVSTVNIFIISFPLTIGIGLILSIFSFPEILVVLEGQFKAIEQSIFVLVKS